MKKLFYIIVFFPLIALAQSTDQNFIKTTTYKVPTSEVPNPTTEQKVQSVTYMDGLGRTIQQIAVGQSGTGDNIVTPIIYDSYGRQVFDYLPIPISGTSMSFVENNTIISDPNSYYTNTYGTVDAGHRFSEKKFESSPLNRVLEQSAPGAAWALGNGHTIKMDYQANSASDVKFYKATANYNSTTQIYDVVISAGATTNYLPSTLYKSVVKDENWVSGSLNTTEEYKNQEGQVVLKRTYNQDDNGTIVNHDTYYIYDQFGNLSLVVPPKAVNPLDATTRNNLCYQYKYDGRNRLVEKKLPEKQWEFIVYDKLDRVVATGPVLAPFKNLIDQQKQGWIISKYDAYNRVVLTAWVEFTNRASLQVIYNGSTVFNETKTKVENAITINQVAFPYTNNVGIKTNFHVLTINYFDDYDFTGNPAAADYTVQMDGINQVYYNNSTQKPKGLPTGSWVRVLENSTDVKAEISYTLYDKKARPVKSYSTNFLGGNISTEIKLDFTGKTLYTITKHKKDASSQILQVREDFTYTAQYRLLTHIHKIGNLPTQLLVKNDYDALGQLTKKSVGGTNLTGATSLQKVDYNYNIRGWLKSINDIDELTHQSDPTDLFAFKINYNEVENDLGGMIEQLYNGNISETFWKTDADNMKRNYGYQYDALNRLTNSIYQKNNIATNSYNEKISYDKNGNILTMYRTGYQDGSEPSSPYEIDKLIYSYGNNSNQLKSVYDDSQSIDGFKDGNLTGEDYRYDSYGNMTMDKNKGISVDGITYNHLNLPVKILISNDKKIEYIYNALGVKLTKVVTNISQQDKTEYLSGFQYMNNQLQFFPTAEGYVSVTNGDKFNYVFNYIDHLGNIRVSYSLDQADQQLKILEENHYYPFGLKHSNYNTNRVDHKRDESGGIYAILEPVDRNKYQYKYNGKELQEELGLNMYDYGARNYDPAIGRWNVMDAKGELYFGKSPYVYALNTPIQAIDPDGNVVIFINGQHTGDGAKGYQDGSNWSGSNDYWRNFDTSKSNWLSQPNKIAFDQLVKNRLGDQNAMYRDGSMGGFNNTLWETNPNKINLSASNRINAGYEQGKKDAATIIKNLARDQSTGEIIETIKIITHSMGGAYGKGYVNALKAYIKTLPKEQQRQIRISLVADFDPFQAGSLKADSNIFTQQFTHLGGFFGLAEDRQEGLSDENYYESNGEHSIFTFVENINDLQEGTYKWNGSEWVCTTCKK